MSAEIVQFQSRAERELLRVYRSLPEHRRGILLEAVIRMADGEPPEDVAVGIRSTRRLAGVGGPEDQRGTAHP